MNTTAHKLYSLFFLFCIFVAGWFVFGWPLEKTRTWHDRVGWNAQDFFDEPTVVELCGYIEAKDLREVERLIDSGVNVNAIGRDGMTPLLWAFPDNCFSSFKALLNAGADPSVVVRSDLQTRGGIECGTTVAHLSASSQFPDHFFEVLKTGVDPDLVYSPCGSDKKVSLLISVIRGHGKNKIDRVRALVGLGIDVDLFETATRVALSGPGEYGIVLALLQAGGSFRVYDDWGKLIHHVAIEEGRSVRMTPEKRSEYLQLVAWLEGQGQDFESAKNDVLRWAEFSRINPKKGTILRKQDIVSLVANEARD